MCFYQRHMPPCLHLPTRDRRAGRAAELQSCRAGGRKEGCSTCPLPGPSSPTRDLHLISSVQPDPRCCSCKAALPASNAIMSISHDSPSFDSLGASPLAAAASKLASQHADPRSEGELLQLVYKPRLVQDSTGGCALIPSCLRFFSPSSCNSSLSAS